MSKRVDIVVIPFHDWRKIQREGTRTRDAHLIIGLSTHNEVGRVVVINRPMTVTEMVGRRRSWKTQGDLLVEGCHSRLVQVDHELYVVDLFDANLLGPLVHGKAWFLFAYAKQHYVDDVLDHLKYLGIRSHLCLSFNLFAAALFRQLPAGARLFDAWDNFLRFPELSRIRSQLMSAYRCYAQVADNWTTNSKSNQCLYQRNFGVADCRVVGNGVEFDPFARHYAVPDDLARLRRPIVGIGAKISHLLDCELINHVVTEHPMFSFVLVGQMLDREVFRSIKKQPNFFYLGDKPYSVYPSYVKNFDVCLVPYVVGEGEHGGDCIKFYEYLAAGKPIVSTMIEGVTDEYGSVFLAAGRDEFARMVRAATGTAVTKSSLPERFSWTSKADELLNVLLKRGSQVAVCQ